jgi:hypothetical protein
VLIAKSWAFLRSQPVPYLVLIYHFITCDPFGVSPASPRSRKPCSDHLLFLAHACIDFFTFINRSRSPKTRSWHPFRTTHSDEINTTFYSTLVAWRHFLVPASRETTNPSSVDLSLEDICLRGLLNTKSIQSSTLCPNANAKSSKTKTLDALRRVIQVHSN